MAPYAEMSGLLFILITTGITLHMTKVSIQRDRHTPEGLRSEEESEQGAH